MRGVKNVDQCQRHAECKNARDIRTTIMPESYGRRNKNYKRRENRGKYKKILKNTKTYRNMQEQRDREDGVLWSRCGLH